jgi:hypothetical protein
MMESAFKARLLTGVLFLVLYYYRGNSLDLVLPRLVLRKSRPFSHGLLLKLKNRLIISISGDISMTQSLSEDLAAIGKQVGLIDVSINYNIIDLFSGHLYTNPSKAVEELVTNSYDAFATECRVSVPAVLDDEARVWVWDNGDSMDFEGLKELWLVAESRKRDPKREQEAVKRGRRPIGKFGIGKLASYALGRRITHICKRENKYLAVTMDFSKLANAKEIHQLSVRNLSADQASVALSFLQIPRKDGTFMDLFKDKKTETWTVVVVDHLKSDLVISRLNWILSTAMPLVSDFRLLLNNEEIKSSKEKIKILKQWQLGKDDDTAEKMGYETGHDSKREPPDDYYVEIPDLGRLSGIVQLYRDPIDTGKSEDTGPSNGFFVKVRERVINTNDTLFGITTLPHLAFNRFRADIHADFLDKYLLASREDVMDTKVKDVLQKYFAGKFNEARNRYEEHMESEAKKEVLEEHLKGIPGTLLSYPLRQAIEKVSGRKYPGFSLRVTSSGPQVSGIEKIETVQLDVGEPLATYESGKVYININHPFYVDFQEFPGIRKLVLAEVLLEAYLLDADVEPDKTSQVLQKRDALLRILSHKFPEGALAVSKFIRESVTQDDEFEIACTDAFNCLGLEAIHIGGSGKPDGLATAHLGYQAPKDNLRYSLTFDAKSSSDPSVQSGNLGLATIVRHRTDYNADFAVVIAPGYQIDEGANSKCVKEALQQRVCLVTAKEFADLILASSVKPLPLQKLRTLFQLCSPLDTSKWISDFLAETPPAPAIRKILDTIWKMQETDKKDAPTISAVRYAEKSLQHFTPDDIKSWLQSVSRLVPELIEVTGDRVQLNQSPPNVVDQAINVLKKVPQRVSADSLASALVKK